MLLLYHSIIIVNRSIHALEARQTSNNVEGDLIACNAGVSGGGGAEEMRKGREFLHLLHPSPS